MSKIKALPVGVLKNIAWVKEGTDCTNGGISSRYDTLYLAVPDGAWEIDEDDPRLIKAVRREIGGRVIWHAEPYKECPPNLCGWMSGGNYVASCDSRVSAATGGFYGALSLHDRCETWEQYEMLSR